MNLEARPDPAPYSVVAFNYAEESENRIHADDTAREYGFRGGLVPGVGDYAYLSRPVVETWGREWLERGWMEAKFLKPVYHGDRVEARAKMSSTDPKTPEQETLALELFDSRGQLCAAGAAGLAKRREPKATADYRSVPLPDFDARPEASLQALAVGTVLGSLELQVEQLEELSRESEERFRDSHALYRDGSPRLLHPALIPDLGNRLLTSNVRLGPWIHTATDAQHFDALTTARSISVRGRVRAAYEKRGHEIVELDVGILEKANATGEAGRCLTHFVHTAIIRPRKLD